MLVKDEVGGFVNEGIAGTYDLIEYVMVATSRKWWPCI
jgi:hypothetical protein